jgi:hypothetical protein
VLIRLSNSNDETAQRILRGLIYTWEARQIAIHRQQAAAEERAKIVVYLRKTFGLGSVAADVIEAKEHLK